MVSISTLSLHICTPMNQFAYTGPLLRKRTAWDRNLRGYSRRLLSSRIRASPFLGQAKALSSARHVSTCTRKRSTSCESKRVVDFPHRFNIIPRYQTLADSTDAQGISPPNSWTSEDVVDWLGEHAASLNGGKAPPPSADVFSHGFDRFAFDVMVLCCATWRLTSSTCSLNATILRNRIIGGLRASGDPSAQNAAKNVSPNFIFDYPTLEQMASAVAGLVDPSSGSVVDEKDRAEHIVEYIEKYSANLPQRANDARRDLPDELSVLLTGSTGNLGSHIVAALLADPHIARVYTLDRPNSGSCSEDRLKHAFADRGLPLALLSNGKLRTLTGELHTEYFGLEPPTLDEVRRRALPI